MRAPRRMQGASIRKKHAIETVAKLAKNSIHSAAIGSHENCLKISQIRRVGKINAIGVLRDLLGRHYHPRSFGVSEARQES